MTSVPDSVVAVDDVETNQPTGNDAENDPKPPQQLLPLVVVARHQGASVLVVLAAAALVHPEVVVPAHQAHRTVAVGLVAHTPVEWVQSLFHRLALLSSCQQQQPKQSVCVLSCALTIG